MTFDPVQARALGNTRPLGLSKETAKKDELYAPKTTIARKALQILTNSDELASPSSAQTEPTPTGSPRSVRNRAQSEPVTPTFDGESLDPVTPPVSPNSAIEGVVSAKPLTLKGRVVLLATLGLSGLSSFVKNVKEIAHSVKHSVWITAVKVQSAIRNWLFTEANPMNDSLNQTVERLVDSYVAMRNSQGNSEKYAKKSAQFERDLAGCVVRTISSLQSNENLEEVTKNLQDLTKALRNKAQDERATTVSQNGQHPTVVEYLSNLIYARLTESSMVREHLVKLAAQAVVEGEDLSEIVNTLVDQRLIKEEAQADFTAQVNNRVTDLRNIIKVQAQARGYNARQQLKALKQEYKNARQVVPFAQPFSDQMTLVAQGKLLEDFHSESFALLQNLYSKREQIEAIREEIGNLNAEKMKLVDLMRRLNSSDANAVATLLASLAPVFKEAGQHVTDVKAAREFVEAGIQEINASIQEHKQNIQEVRDSAREQVNVLLQKESDANLEAAMENSHVDLATVIGFIKRELRLAGDTLRQIEKKDKSEVRETRIAQSLSKKGAIRDAFQSRYIEARQERKEAAHARKEAARAKEAELVTQARLEAARNSRWFNWFRG